MKGLILSGGKGTRLAPLTYTRAKQLVPIANRANIDYAVRDLTEAGITDIGVVISPETGPEVQAHLGNGEAHGARFTFILQDRPGGLAHAVKTAESYLGQDDFIMYLGDNLLDGGIGHILEKARTERADACILLTPVENPQQFGVAVLNARGQVERLVEKPREFIGNLALVGVYYFTPRVHPVIRNLKPSARGELEITEAIQGLLDGGANVVCAQVNGWWKDTGRPEDLLDANRLVLNRLQRHVEGSVDGTEIVGNVHVSPGASVVNSRLRGPIHIAEHARIENSYVGPYTSIGQHAEVIDSEVEYSILMNHASVRHLARRLDSSILGEHAAISGSETHRNTMQLVLSDRSRVEL
ncbi:MAG TPA: glucose-1-phosphate thymidylyltransferase [Deinococcales bacterium]|nr:glucose-1-phosphate thymidylyltransferase [Deinococcales bacterium]